MIHLRSAWKIALALAALTGFVLVLLSLPVGTAVAAKGGDPTALSQSGQYIKTPAYFAENCVECHGADAEGNGPRYTEFIPEPANLTLVHDSPTMLMSIIKNGVQGTAMGPHPNLTKAQFDDISGYLAKLPQKMQIQWAWPYEFLDRHKGLDDMGRSIYLTNCAGCHGLEGMGKAAPLNDSHFWPKPANFWARNSELGRVYYIISNGRPGTMMGAQKWTFQSEVPRWALAQYVNGLYHETATDTIPTGTFEEYRNLYTIQDSGVVSDGSTLYGLYCAYCHFGSGSLLAPNLTDRYWRYGGGTDNFIFTIVQEGLPGKLMPPHTKISVSDRWKIITYLRQSGGLPDPMESLVAGEEVGKR